MLLRPMRAPCYSLRLASAGVYFILLLALRLVNCQYRYHFPRRRHNHFLVDFAYCVPTMAVTGVRFGICVYLRHLLLRTKRDRRRLQIDKGVIVSAIVIVVKSVELNRKRTDECSGLFQTPKSGMSLDFSRDLLCVLPMPSRLAS